ncbi:MAG: tetratricopeptide repeat protein [Anaerolineae bacterium]|nr:tetratricopeptide repeat protein [Anaerolineae bacterium]
MVDRLTNTLSDFGDADTTNTEIQDRLTGITEDYGRELNTQYAVQWLLTTFITAYVAQWTARRFAVSPAQAVGYGTAIGIGVSLSYGLLCVMCSIAMLLLRLLFLGALIGAGWLGGRMASQNLDPNRPLPEPSPGRRRGGQPARPDQSGFMPGAAGPDVFYNMGVSAALGGRREEARQHFTHVLQMQPRNVAAWLQLANLADTPEQAWNYVQQARAISPNDPAVQDAADVIWPKVAASANLVANVPPETPAPPPPTAQNRLSAAIPRAQPPYKGGAVDDTAIPRITLPHPPEDAAVSTDSTDDADHDDPVDRGDPVDDDSGDSTPPA